MPKPKLRLPTPAATRFSAASRLSLLHLLHLLRVSLLHLLRLLLVLLLHLLRSRWSGLLFRQLLMFLVLLLLEFLPVLVLLRDQLLLLLLVFLVLLCVPRLRRAGRSTGGSSLGWDAGLARRVAVTGGAPWFAEYRCWGLLRAEYAC